MLFQHEHGLRKNIKYDRRYLYQRLVDKYGKEEADARYEQFKINLTDAMKRCDKTRQKEVAKQQMVERNKSTVGKTLEEIYGEDKAYEIRKKLSDSRRGEKNPAYGKTYKSGGKSVKGYYKGFFFRSLLEYSFMKHLESLGRSLKSDVSYESFSVKYTLNGSNRTYKIDFFDSLDQIAYEVKPSYIFKANKVLEEQRNKWDAAKTYFDTIGITFKVVTDKDFTKVSFDDAKKDPDVLFDERTFAYFKRTE